MGVPLKDWSSTWSDPRCTSAIMELKCKPGKNHQSENAICRRMLQLLCMCSQISFPLGSRLLTEVGYVYIWEQNSMQKVVWPMYRAGTKVDTEVRTRLKLLPIKLYAPSHLVSPSFSSLILVGVMGDILASQACWENQRRFWCHLWLLFENLVASKTFSVSGLRSLENGILTTCWNPLNSQVLSSFPPTHWHTHSQGPLHPNLCFPKRLNTLLSKQKLSGEF